MDRALRDIDITPTQFYALAHIAQSPGLSSAELARGLMTTPQAVATLDQAPDGRGSRRTRPGSGEGWPALCGSPRPARQAPRRP